MIRSRSRRASLSPVRWATAALLAAAPAAAQTPGGPGLHARVDSIFAPWDRSDSPGCALGVGVDGRTVYERGYGMANLELGVPIAPASVFDIGSTSKQFTAAAIALLAQQGKLSLDDDTRRWIPELPDYGAPLTLRQLLQHTSGLRDYIGLLTLAGHHIDDVTTGDDALAILARQKELNFAPGSEHLYSNSGYFLASLVVERASGQTLREFAAEHLFRPLGMERTAFRDDHTALVPGRASAYAPGPDGAYRQDISYWEQTGDGAVFSTVGDLLRWGHVLNEPTGHWAMLADTLQAPGALNDGSPLSYALGLAVADHRGMRMVEHGGSWGGYRAGWVRFPEAGLSVAALCNLSTTHPTTLATRVAEIYLGDRLEPVARTAAAPVRGGGEGPALTAAELRELAGTYRHPKTRALRTVSLDDGGLVLSLGGSRLELRPLSRTRFATVGAPVELEVEFLPAAAGGARALRQIVGGQPATVFEEIEVVAPTPDQLRAYEGAFYSPELDAEYTVALGPDGLTLRAPRSEPDPLRPLTRDEFSTARMSVRFVRDAPGTVEGFLLDLGRIRNLRFSRVR